MRTVVFDIETKDSFADVGRADPALLHLSLVGAYDSATDTYTSYLEAELPSLWPLIEAADVLVGYNSDHFDIPLLNKYYPGDLHSLRSLDLMAEVKRACGKRLRLDALAAGTLGVRKSGSGLEAIRWWRQGEIEKLRSYCLDDVKITKELYDYARTHGSLKYEDLGRVRELKLDVSGWERPGNSTLTHTLPF